MINIKKAVKLYISEREIQKRAGFCKFFKNE